MYILVVQNTNLQKLISRCVDANLVRATVKHVAGIAKIVQDEVREPEDAGWPASYARTQNIEGKGIALVADQVINRDELVAQYVGEVVSLSQYIKREKEQFSCSPNCVVERWEVAGETCCGIFAKRDIHPGDELTIYYGKDPRAPSSRTASMMY
ncbi:SET domain [Phytophthora cactorum]|nr:SET domain [Phytophthora cactorum]